MPYGVPKWREHKQGGTAMAQCKKCDTEIEWRQTRNAAMIALDVVTTGRGKRYVVVAGVARMATETDKQLHREFRSCHFDTCSKRDQR